MISEAFPIIEFSNPSGTTEHHIKNGKYEFKMTPTLSPGYWREALV
jgi:hypothetical protein